MQVDFASRFAAVEFRASPLGLLPVLPGHRRQSAGLAFAMPRFSIARDVFDAPRRRSSHMNRKLYVGNLPYETGDQDLQDLFGQAGPVERVNVVRDMATGRPRGFAFVEMGTDDGARKAIADIDQQEFGGRRLTVNEARPRETGRGGFDGGATHSRGRGKW
jgi:RNA recognition motif-containing protein